MATITDVTPENVQEETLFCIKDIKKPGFNSKRIWFEKHGQSMSGYGQAAGNRK